MSATDDLSLTSYRALADDFLRRLGRDVDQERRWFGDKPRNLEEAISRACLSQIPSGRGAGTKRHSHQTRLPLGVLAEAKLHLLARAGEISDCQNFSSLFRLVEASILPIPGVGELYVYDVAQRIGAFLRIEPEDVYLHTGTRLGCRAIGLSTRRKSVPIADFPPGLRRLSGSQLEDVLCIYRDALARIASGEPSKAPRRRC